MGNKYGDKSTIELDFIGGDQTLRGNNNEDNNLWGDVHWLVGSQAIQGEGGGEMLLPDTYGQLPTLDTWMAKA